MYIHNRWFTIRFSWLIRIGYEQLTLVQYNFFAFHFLCAFLSCSPPLVDTITRLVAGRPWSLNLMSLLNEPTFSDPHHLPPHCPPPAHSPRRYLFAKNRHTKHHLATLQGWTALCCSSLGFMWNSSSFRTILLYQYPVQVTLHSILWNVR